MKKFIAKHFNLLILLLLITGITIPIVFKENHLLQIITPIICILLFCIFYIIHDEELSKINRKVFDKQYIMREHFNKELTDEEIDKIYNEEYNKYFNGGN